MNLHTFNQRRAERESRFCYFDSLYPDAPKFGARDGVPDYIGKLAASGIEWISRMSSYLSAEMVEQAGRIALSLPIGLARGVGKAINSMPTANEAYDDLMKMGAFFQALPFARDFYPMDLEEITNIETLRNLTSEVQWLNAFKTPGILEEKKQDKLPASDALFGPETLLRLLEPAKRQELYLQFVGAYIPQHVQEIHKLKPVADGDPFDAIKGKVPVVNAAMIAMLGESDFKWMEGRTKDEIEEAEQIAKTSLQDYYQRADSTGIDALKKAGKIDDATVEEMLAKRKNGFIPNNLRTDYRDARKLFAKGTSDSVLTDTKQVKNKLPLGRLRGALALGVVQRDDLERMHVGLRREDQTDSLVIDDVTSELNKLSGSAKERIIEENKGIMDMFHGMGGAEKLMLLIGGGIVLATSKWARRGAMLLGGAYFFQRLVLKDKDPTKRWSDLIYGITGKVKNATASVAGEGVVPGHIPDISNRANTMVGFLGDFDRADLEQQAVGLSLLSDMPMSSLAINFRMDGPEGADGMHLDVTSGGQLDLQMAAAMKTRGWTDDYRAFFDDAHNQVEVAEAMSFVFFKRAAENPSNASRVKLITETLGREMPGMSIVDFSRYVLAKGPSIQSGRTDANIHAAYEAYIYLVREGKDASRGDNLKLGDFVKSRTFVPSQYAIDNIDKIENNSDINDEDIINGSPFGKKV